MSTKKDTDQQYLEKANGRLKRINDAVAIGRAHGSESQMQIAHIVSSVIADDFDAQAIRDSIKSRLYQLGGN